jgi:RND family efflux transporter MFP subunit
MERSRSHCLARRRWSALVAGIVAATCAAQQGGPPTAVTVDAVRREPVQEHRRVTGELRAVHRSRVATREAGLLIELPVTQGTRVSAGEVLARLDSRLVALDLRHAEAEHQAAKGVVQERQAVLGWRRKSLELYQQSATRGAANVKEMLDAESEVSVAAARAEQGAQELEVAAARVEILRQRLADMTITAPFDGIVVARLADLGEWVGEGAPIVELVSVGEVEAWLDVPQQFFGVAGRQLAGVKVSVEATGQMIEAQRLRTVAMVDPRARSFSVVGMLDDADGALAPGMSITGWIPTGATAQRLTVSSDALLRNDAGAYVYVARGGSAPGAEPGPSMAVPLGVRVLFPAGNRVVVEAEGLNPGDSVVVEGNERLFPMMPIMGLPAPGAPGPSSGAGS